jgi:hypothetical protein
MEPEKCSGQYVTHSVGLRPASERECRTNTNPTSSAREHHCHDFAVVTHGEDGGSGVPIDQSLIVPQL